MGASCTWRPQRRLSLVIGLVSVGDMFHALIREQRVLINDLENPLPVHGVETLVALRDMREFISQPTTLLSS